jgi:aryl-alcohol dehydrogenase-like predicted oxidoreductase
MDGFVRAGKVAYWGLSNFTGWQLTTVVHLARALGVAVPVTLQPQYSLLVREIEWEIVPAAVDAGLGLLPWSPLGGGYLSGKYTARAAAAARTRLGDDPAAAWRPGSGAAPSAPGGDRRGAAVAEAAASRWPRSRWPGSPTGPA